MSHILPQNLIDSINRETFCSLFNRFSFFLIKMLLLFATSLLLFIHHGQCVRAAPGQAILHKLFATHFQNSKSVDDIVSDQVSKTTYTTDRQSYISGTRNSTAEHDTFLVLQHKTS